MTTTSPSGTSGVGPPPNSPAIKTVGVPKEIKTAEYRAPSPSALEEFIFYSHPSVENRIRAAMEWKKAHPAGAPQTAPTK